jgi:hypothetical protein
LERKRAFFDEKGAKNEGLVLPIRQHAKTVSYSLKAF